MKEIRRQGDNVISTFEEFADGISEARLYYQRSDGEWAPPLPADVIPPPLERNAIAARTRTIERIGGEAQLVAKRPKPKPASPSEYVPELRAGAKPTLTVRLRAQALREINRELDRDGGRAVLDLLETGGNLVGRARHDGFDVLDASGPMSAPEGDTDARRLVDAVKISLRPGFGIADELARQHQDSAITYLGGWHSHPGQFPEPSTTDRAAALRSLQIVGEEFGWRAPDKWVDLIFTPDARDGWANPRAYGWVTRVPQWGAPVTEPCNIEAV